MKGDLLMSADVARLAGVTPATVRWWETHGLLPAKKTTSGRRVFLRSDVDVFLAERQQAAAQRPGGTR